MTVMTVSDDDGEDGEDGDDVDGDGVDVDVDVDSESKNKKKLIFKKIFVVKIVLKKICYNGLFFSKKLTKHSDII
jgi:hypothetical protein